MSEPRLRGTVLRVDNLGRTVLVDDRSIRCSVRGTLNRELKQSERGRVVVGDHVELTEMPDGAGVIEVLLPRRSQISRRAAGERRREQISAANLDRIVCVAACADPEWKPGFVDRVLCAAELNELPGVLVLNKVDLLDEDGREFLEEQLSAYREIDPDSVYVTSVETGEGIDRLRELLIGSVSAVYGPSGVGKSSLLNVIEPGLGQATREISGSSRKGRHTTTAVTMHALREGGFVIDTPGVRAFGFYDLTPRGLSYLFKDIRPYAYYEEGGERSERCRFLDCLHQDEPGCAVIAAVDEGVIADARYLSYLNILQSLLEEKR